MKGSEPNIQNFLLDTNVFISAIKESKRQTDTLRLIIKVISDASIKLVGNYLLAYEMIRYAEVLKSETATIMLAALLSKVQLIQISKNYIKICSRYIKTPDKADILHAATCLQTGSILITNDRHFDRIKAEGIIEVWNVSKAIRQLV
jgi:predicted nucleic acid-binding protein